MAERVFNTDQASQFYGHSWSATARLTLDFVSLLPFSCLLLSLSMQRK
jgi:hypothetical protein